MPEFWTWWIENGPTTSSDSPSDSCDETIHFVTWSAAIAETATAPSSTHCRVRAASDRRAPSTGTTPFVDDPTRISVALPSRPPRPSGGGTAGLGPDEPGAGNERGV